MSEGRRTFNLQNKEQMEEFNRLFRRDYAGRKSDGMEENKKHSSSDRDMRDISEAV